MNAQELTLYISTLNQAANVTVSINGTAWAQTLNIPANTANATIIIPKAGINDARILSDGLSNKAIHVVSDVPVAVYSHQYDDMYSAATMLMPTETWGYNYYSINYYQTQGRSNPPYVISNQGINFPDWYNWFYIVAKDDNTRVLITPSDSCKNGWLPGQTYTVNLNKGEIYTVFGKANFAAGWFSDTVNSSKDLTGSKILSVAGADGKCHPVALFSGTGGVHTCQKDGGETVQQQVFPAQAWGTRYLTHHTISNFTGDINATFRNYYRVCVKDPTTVVKRNGVPMTGLIRNFYYQYVDSTGGDYIEADKPILVSQYIPNRAQCWENITPAQTAIGDPEMFYLSPIEQGQNSVVFYTSSLNLISKSYLNIIIPTPGISSLLVDGSAVPASKIKVHPNNPAYSVAIADLSGTMDMQHTITSDSAFTATVYGLGAYESYGYNIGCNINNLDFKSEIKNVFGTTSGPDTITCPKTPFRIFAKTGYQLTNIQWKFSQVAGLTPNADSVIANPVPISTPVINGRQYYTYTVQQDLQFASPGTYKIPVSYSAPNIDACNNTETDTIVVVVKPGPPADFSISNQLCLADTVRFTGTTSTVGGQFNYINYLWNFDDATTQNTINAKKRFATTGPHDVRYRVYADNGCIGDTTKTITIINGSGPQLSFTISGNRCKDSVLTFTSSITPNATNPTTWYWDFGGGQTVTSSTSNSTTHSFPATGTNIPVRHSATLTTGCQPDTITVLVPVIYDNPAASFTLTADTLCPGKPVSYSSAISPASVRNWSWNFGNGTGTQIPSFNRPFVTSGTYTVSLVITDTSGCGSAPFNRNITINPNPSVNAGPDKYISVNTSTTLDAAVSPAGTYSYLWTPGTYLSSSTILNPVSTPAFTPITYTLEVTDRNTFCAGKDAVTIVPVSELYIPTAFTPNNDGRNDNWNIPGLALYPDAVVSVYNRWGEKIYESKNYFSKPWNGYYKGVLQPGTYVYTIQLNDDKKRFYKGTVTIIQ
ncbi:MAG TPA: PKD domain-containing protein [Chitinophagaceae bacterium]|nr:PKD domain-containing protein [Chitinophagaceae bacterium]